MPASAARAGMVGKAPCHADFLRINAASSLAFQLHRWLADGVETARAARCGLPSATISFLFTAPKEKNVLLGVLAPSTDGVGRDFPLAVFTELPAPPAANRLALLPAAFRPFLTAGASLLRAAASMDLPELTRHVELLPQPAQEDLGVAERHLRTLLVEKRGAELLDPLRRPGEVPGSPYYAFHTFRTACAGERHRQQTLANVILECPLTPALGPVAWLELATRLLRWPFAPPALAWCEDGEPRLLLCLGAMAGDVFLHLASPTHGGTRLWPLRTTRAAAIDQARQALSENQRQLIDSPTTSLEELLQAMSR
ncbi:MAG TPA: type VI secretion system-associated protein TagF [Archangium sp.]|nr:type VI secretion system-associated protein TagF [Archangium sp.]